MKERRETYRVEATEEGESVTAMSSYRLHQTCEFEGNLNNVTDDVPGQNPHFFLFIFFVQVCQRRWPDRSGDSMVLVL